MAYKLKNLLAIFGCIFIFFTCRYFMYELGYCPAKQRLIGDAELIKRSMDLREGEIAR